MDSSENLNSLEEALHYIKKKHKISRFSIDCINRIEVMKVFGLGIGNCSNWTNFLLRNENGEPIENEVKPSYDQTYSDVPNAIHWKRYELDIFKQLLRYCKHHSIFVEKHQLGNEENASILAKGDTLEMLLIKKDLDA